MYAVIRSIIDDFLMRPPQGGFITAFLVLALAFATISIIAGGEMEAPEADGDE